MRSPRLLSVLLVVGLVTLSSMVPPVARADSTGIADLVVTQLDSPDPVPPGLDVTYSISVANTPGEGTGDSSNVSLAVGIPTNGSFVGVSTQDGTCGGPDVDGNLVCDLGSILHGEVAAVSVVVTALGEGTMTNIASVTATETDPTPGDASSIESTTVHVPTADLAVSGSDDPDPARVGQTVTYSLLVSNGGPDSATDLTLTDTLPAVSTFVDATSDAGSCGPPVSGVVTCDLGSIGPTQSVSVDVLVEATTVGPMTNDARVTSAEFDPVADNTSSETTTVTPRSANLRVSQADAPDPVVLGEQVTYDVRVVNDGPDTGTEVTMTDTLPAGSTFVGTTGDGVCGPPSSGQVSCALGSLAPGEMAQCSVTVVATALGSMTNTAAVAANEEDPDPADDQTSEATLVLPAPAIPPTSDFDGDGYADLALGTPRRNLPAVKDAGAATAVYGSQAGLDPSRGQLWHEGVAGVAGTPAVSDLEGYALATGDLSGDGYADLAMGAPFEDVDGVANAGSVLVLFGSASGLGSSGSVEITEATAGVPGDPAKGAQFGYAVAIGDFDGDGVLDLAVGAPREMVGGVRRGGSVTVIPGSDGGLGTSFATSIAPGSGALVPPEEDSGFGSVLEAGDVDSDGWADLAIGVPRADVSGVANTGAVDVIRGSPAGLSPSKAKRWTQDAQGIPDGAEPGDGFGSELAAGDLNGDGRPDLVVAAPREDLAGASDAGVVHVLPGASKGVRGSGSTVWSQNSPGIPGSAGGADNWGLAVAVGDLNGDGVADLASGARYDDEAGFESSGTVNVLFGGPQGLGSANSELWSQASTGIADDPEPSDHFGSVLAIGRFGQDSAGSLAIGVHFEDVGNLTHAGALHVVPGSPVGLDGSGSTFWLEGDLAAGQGTAAFDYFPFALAAR